MKTRVKAEAIDKKTGDFVSLIVENVPEKESLLHVLANLVLEYPHYNFQSIALNSED
jgi:hypothetical protein